MGNQYKPTFLLVMEVEQAVMQLIQLVTALDCDCIC